MTMRCVAILASTVLLAALNLQGCDGSNQMLRRLSFQKSPSIQGTVYATKGTVYATKDSPGKDSPGFLYSPKNQPSQKAQPTQTFTNKRRRHDEIEYKKSDTKDNNERRLSLRKGKEFGGVFEDGKGVQPKDASKELMDVYDKMEKLRRHHDEIEYKKSDTKDNNERRLSLRKGNEFGGVFEDGEGVQPKDEIKEFTNVYDKDMDMWRRRHDEIEYKKSDTKDDNERRLSLRKGNEFGGVFEDGKGVQPKDEIKELTNVYDKQMEMLRGRHDEIEYKKSDTKDTNKNDNNH